MEYDGHSERVRLAFQEEQVRPRKKRRSWTIIGVAVATLLGFAYVIYDSMWVHREIESLSLKEGNDSAKEKYQAKAAALVAANRSDQTSIAIAKLIKDIRLGDSQERTKFDKLEETVEDMEERFQALEESAKNQSRRLQIIRDDQNKTVQDQINANNLDQLSQSLTKMSAEMNATKASLDEGKQKMNQVDQKLEWIFRRIQVLRTNQCPNGWTNVSNWCYFLSCDKVLYHEAAKRCQEKGGMLFEPETIDINDAVSAAFSSCTYWIGIHDVDQEGRFVYESTGKEIHFSKWAPKQPDIYKKMEDCVQMYQSTPTWNDAICDQSKLGYACQL